MIAPFQVWQGLAPISPMFTIAAAFGNVHGVYKARIKGLATSSCSLASWESFRSIVQGKSVPPTSHSLRSLLSGRLGLTVQVIEGMQNAL
eukprot:531386-Amphidinium_carterae.1